MLDQLSILKLVTGRLDAADVPYMVTRSIAAAHYGRPRMTRAIDIVVTLGPQDASRFAAVLGAEFGADTDSIHSAIARRAMFNVIHETAVVKVDFVVRKDDPYHVEEFRRRRSVRIDDHDVWMVGPEDLLLSKLLWAKDSRSELQLRDVRSVVRIQAEALDWPILERWAKRLTVANLLREVR